MQSQLSNNSATHDHGKPKTSLKLPITALVAVALGTLGFQIGLLPSYGPAGLGVFGLVLTICWVQVCKERIFRVVPAVLELIALSVSAGLIIRANEFIQGFFPVVLFLTQVLLYVYYVWLNYSQSFSQTVSLVYRSLFKLARQVEAVISAGRSQGNHNSLASWLKTGFILISVLGFFSLLLFQADAVFAQIVRQLALADIISRLVWLGIIGVFLTSAWSTPKDDTNLSEIEIKIVSLRDLTVAIAGLIVLFGIFLFIQWQYLFAGTKDMLVELNLTLSEYVRKGFLELLGVVFFGSLVVYINSLKVRQTASSSLQKTLQALTAVGIIELFLLLGSALKRDLMYVDAYGLTRMRIVGEVFLVWLAVILILLSAFVLVKRMKEKVMFTGTLFVSLGAILFFTFFNMDRYLWAAAPGHHNYTDYYYLSNLSADVGEELFTQSLPKMQTEIALLTSKGELTDIEKSQLAGIKLALLTLRQQRNRAYIQAATAQDIWARNRQLGYDFKNFSSTTLLRSEGTWKDNFRNAGPYQLEMAWQKSLLAGLTEDVPATQSTVLPKFITRRQHWQQVSLPQGRLNRFVLSHPELFTQIDELVVQIRRYQATNRIDLQNQEQLLIHELKYPLMQMKFREWEYLDNIIKDLNAGEKVNPDIPNAQ